MGGENGTQTGRTSINRLVSARFFNQASLRVKSTTNDESQASWHHVTCILPSASSTPPRFQALFVKGHVRHAPDSLPERFLPLRLDLALRAEHQLDQDLHGSGVRLRDLLQCRLQSRRRGGSHVRIPLSTLLHVYNHRSLRKIMLPPHERSTKFGGCLEGDPESSKSC